MRSATTPMTPTITIEPVTRIEGHAKITVRLDPDGAVQDARLHITEFRGFEEFCRGRPVWEMPSLTARVCGICPVSHLLASARALDGIMGITPPRPARMLRTLANLGQLVQSHALSFFHLSGPDLLLGLDSDPTARNILGLMATDPDLARRGIRLRAFGQSVIEAVAGRKVHAPGIVGGGIAQPMPAATRDAIRAALPEARQAAELTLQLYLSIADRFEREIRSFGEFPSLFLGLANHDGTWEHQHHKGHLRVIDSHGATVADRLDPFHYRDWIGEAAVPDSYLKAPYIKPFVSDGQPLEQGMYRVGALARVNLCERMGTPVADEALAQLRSRAGRVVLSSFHYHHARLIEVLGCLERMERVLDDPLLLDPNVRAEGSVSRRRGVGVSEAPRGTLFHEYEVDEYGIVTDVNLIIATGQNALAMNRTLTQIAREYITGPQVPEGVLNRLEAGIRAFDPCFSCSTHAVGSMPLVVVVRNSDGDEVSRTGRG
jgi:NAD-reducing hydrogenase large subunit